MGIKDLDALAKTIKPFRQDVCHNSVWSENNTASSSSACAVDILPTENHSSNQRQRQRRPDRAVYVPRGRRSQTTPPTAPVSDCDTVSKSLGSDKESVNVIAPPNLLPTNQSTVTTETTATTEPVIQTKQASNYAGCTSEPKSNIIQTPPIAVDEEKPHLSPENINSATNMADTDVKGEGSKIETVLSNGDKDYNEDKEFQRASKEINRRNRRIIKQTFDSDVLEINETPSVTPKQCPLEIETKPPTKSKLPQVEMRSSANSTTQLKRTEKASGKADVNRETDDWESIFDDNGECLDPKLMKEITSNVGKVTISKPKNDYKNYQEPVNLDEEEFPHVLEVSNFPVEFKTQDLMMIFAEYKELGFDIKWVDDTHALVVFSSSKIAARALSTPHSFIKLKPLKQATAESRARAKKSALFLQPYRQRPETCAALARRLVTGALGVRLSTAREEREVERRVLKEAKERKLLAAKLRDEAWEN